MCMHAPPCTPLHVHIQVSQLPRLHTHTTHVLTHQAPPRQGAANAQAGHMHHCGHASLHTRGRSCLCMLMLPFLCTPINGLVPVDTHTHIHTHTEVAHNSSYKCAGTKVKGTNSTGLHISSGWGGAHDSLHLPPNGWTRPFPSPTKGHSTQDNDSGANIQGTGLRVGGGAREN